MEQISKMEDRRPTWFVGAAFGGGVDDQTERFLRDGIWENGHRDHHIDDVKSIVVGDRIAIKALFTRKRALGFDSQGHSVAGMKIKAIGRVTQNMGDGRHLKVAWTRVDPPREWLFYTYRKTVWKVQRGSGSLPQAADALIRFAFYGEDQDVDWFRNHPRWRSQFGDQDSDYKRFPWTRFYSSVADGLLQYQKDRGSLLSAVLEMIDRLQIPFPTQDRFSDRTRRQLEDICPFTTIGCFNRNITDENRRSFARELSKFLSVEEATPMLRDEHDGIPLLDNRNSWYFGYEKDRGSDDIELLWGVFSDCIRCADEDSEDTRSEFERSYDRALLLKGVGIAKLTMALFWVRPWSFPTLDGNSIKYIGSDLGEAIPDRYRPTGAEYLELRDKLFAHFNDPDYPVHSFPELSLKAYNPVGSGGGGSSGISYTVDEIVKDGCFLPRKTVGLALRRLEGRKNLILQGPPGTGKTWLARRLAYALIGCKDDTFVKRFQFHPNLSYEDFVRGHRPTAGKLDLVDGPFLDVITAAQKDLDKKYVVVIEEINRGNPAQIFGEMLTLLESDKRNADEALALAVPRDENERVHIPSNVYVIGTMNVADRSLALVDLALRRRFTFVDLVPTFGDPWRRWMYEHGGVDESHLRKIEQRVTALNEAIASDQSLGRQFQVGHSYVTTPPGKKIDDPVSWFREVVETEIGPLLREYWFDQIQTAEAHERRLLEGF